MVCDADTYYCLNVMPYLGKGTTVLARAVKQGEYVVVLGSLWFTSLPLAKALLNQGMYMVDTMSQALPPC